MSVNRKAWGILKEDEKTALGLQLGMQKSSWQSGEIMDKSHYKYLEIKYRAEKFLKMFTEHYELYDCLIPKDLPGINSVIDYFVWCIEFRLKPMEAIDRIMINYSKLRKEDLNGLLITQLRQWQKSEDPYQLAVFDLVKEFDRWNNYRILPREIQEPSAFKRRISKMYKKHIKVLTSIPKLSLIKLKQLSKTNKEPFAYLPIFNEAGQIEVWKVKDLPKSVELYSSISFYIFADKQEAQDYITHIFHYVNQAKKDCKNGLKFWSNYRICIKKAKNYNQIQQIIPSRKYLETAFYKLTFV